MDVWVKAWVSLFPLILLFGIVSRIFPDKWVAWIIDDYFGPVSVGIIFISTPFLLIYLIWK